MARRMGRKLTRDGRRSGRYREWLPGDGLGRWILNLDGVVVMAAGWISQDRWGVCSQIRLAKGDSMSASARKRQNFWVPAK